MAVQPTYKHKVRALKVNKTDNDSQELRRELRSAESLIIQHTDATVEYNILSRTEFDTYWYFDVQVPWNISGSDTTGADTVLEPTFTEDFRNSEYNALLNNANDNSKSRIRQVIDYSTGIEDPVNLPAILANAAGRAELQEFNYVAKGSRSGKYEGKQLSGSVINQYTTGDISIGKDPVVESLGANLIEFFWGGGTSPLIMDAGLVNLGKIITVGSTKDSVEVISKNKGNYDTVLTQAIQVNDTINIEQYGNNTVNAGKLRVIANNISIPSSPSYMIPIGSAQNSEFNVSPTVDLRITGSIPTVGFNSNGTYTTGSLETPNEVSALGNDLTAGRRVFITFYDTLGNDVEYSGTNKTKPHRFISKKDFEEDPYPLNYYGVREITSISYDGAGTTRVDFKFNYPIETDWGDDILGGTIGAIIWVSNDENIVVAGNTLSGLGPGALYQEFSSDLIVDELDYITTTYGSNPG